MIGKSKKLEKRQGLHIRPAVDHALHGARRDVQDADLAVGLIRKLNHLGILKSTKINELLANFVRPVLGCLDADFQKQKVTKNSSESSQRYLQDLRAFAPLRPQYFSIIS